MAYNVFVVLSDPFRFWSLIMILYRRRWDEMLLIYGLYFLLELYPFFTIQRKVNSGYKYLVLALYPISDSGTRRCAPSRGSSGPTSDS